MYDPFDRESREVPDEVPLHSTSRWFDKDFGTSSSSTAVPVDDTLPFSVNPAIAAKVRWITCAHIGRLDVGALAMSLNDGTRSLEMKNEILELGGEEMVDEFEHVMGDKFASGEARSVKGWGNLSAKYVLPFVGPAYKAKFHGAAVRTLHSSIREVLKLASEFDCRSVAIPMSYVDPRAQFPQEDAVHTILRTTRRWLEQLPCIETVVFFTNDASVLDTFGALLPLYFPRTAAEAHEALARLPSDYPFGDEFGELHSKSADMLHPPDHAEVETLNFAPFCANDCKGRGAEDMQDEILYMHYLREAHQMRTEMWTEMQKLCFLYVRPPIANDVFSVPIVTLIGANWPQNVAHEFLMQYVVRTLDPVVRSEYSFLYVHSSASYHSSPSLQMLQEVLRMAQLRYKYTLKRFYILHPTWAVKAALALGWAFMSTELWENTVYCESIRDLEEFVRGKVQLPAFVTSYERDYC